MGHFINDYFSNFVKANNMSVSHRLTLFLEPPKRYLSKNASANVLKDIDYRRKWCGVKFEKRKYL